MPKVGTKGRMQSPTMAVRNAPKKVSMQPDRMVTRLEFPPFKWSTADDEDDDEAAQSQIDTKGDAGSAGQQVVDRREAVGRS